MASKYAFNVITLKENKFIVIRLSVDVFCVSVKRRGERPFPSSTTILFFSPQSPVIVIIRSSQDLYNLLLK